MIQDVVAANNASTARLNDIINQLKNCGRYGNVGSSLQNMQSQGKVVLDSSQPSAAGWTSGWWNPTIHISPDGDNIDPVTVVHEWWHASRAQGQVLIPLWIGANNINALFTHDNQGFLDWWAESAAQNIVSMCGVK